MDPLKLKTPEPEPATDCCIICHTYFDAQYPASMDDPSRCSECAKLTHFERELLWALNRIGDALEAEDDNE